MNKALLIILDGFGYRKDTEKNAVAEAPMPFYDSLLEKYPHTTLKAAAEHVGLPKKTMGNSEVGHLTIGSGRVINQDCRKIDQAIETKQFEINETLKDFFSAAAKRDRSIHLIGLLSDAGVHAHIDHLLALLKLADTVGVRTYLHLFTDGRDMDPHSALPLLEKVEKAIEKSMTTWIATVGGRYYGMDRDKRWKRTKLAYDALVDAKGLQTKTAKEAVEQAYDRDESDEFIQPTVIGDYPGLRHGDHVFSFNFRADRARQLCWALHDKSFKNFECSEKRAELATMTLYDEKNLTCPVAFPKDVPENTIADVLSRKHVKQLHVAETEKYAHVTYFFNGGREKPFDDEDRVLVESPKVATYDLQPEMNAKGVVEETLKGITAEYPFIVVNFANPDMVGHTGKFNATKKALAVVDESLKEIIIAALEKGYVPFITADHGNCEQMTEGLTTAHTLNDVPFVVCKEGVTLKKGGLDNVAATILEIMDIHAPKDMSPSVIVG